MDIKEQVAVKILDYAIEIDELKAELTLADSEIVADQVIPLVRADCQREIGQELYDMVVESGEHTDLTLEGEKRKLCFISNKLRPIINALQSGTFKEAGIE